MLPATGASADRFPVKHTSAHRFHQAKPPFEAQAFDWLLPHGTRLAALTVILGWEPSVFGLLEPRGYLLVGLSAAGATLGALRAMRSPQKPPPKNPARAISDTGSVKER
jgi:hypothetical protein